MFSKNPKGNPILKQTLATPRTHGERERESDDWKRKRVVSKDGVLRPHAMIDVSTLGKHVDFHTQPNKV